MPQQSSTPLLDRLQANRERRNSPRPLYPLQPTTLSPFVRAAREKALRPKAFCGGSYLPDGKHAA